MPKKIWGPVQICEMSDTVTATPPAKSYTLIIIIRNTRFIYYSDIKLAEILQFDMFILYKE